MSSGGVESLFWWLTVAAYKMRISLRVKLRGLRREYTLHDLSLTVSCVPSLVQRWKLVTYMDVDNKT
jgi:hypothetical protein